MPQNLRGLRPRRFGHNLLITSSLLVVKLNKKPKVQVHLDYAEASDNNFLLDPTCVQL